MSVERWELIVCGVFIFFLMCGEPLGMLISDIIERYKERDEG